MLGVVMDVFLEDVVFLSLIPPGNTSLTHLYKCFPRIQVTPRRIMHCSGRKSSDSITWCGLCGVSITVG